MDLLIVEDEPEARSGLLRLCQRSPELHVVGEAATGAKAIEAVQSLRPDLVLLDADLPDMSGLDVLRSLQIRHKRRTILLTASTGDASGAFAAGALDFLVKPVNEAAFSATILRARARGLPADTRPLLLIGEREHRLYPLEPCQIDYVESAGNYVTYHLAGIEYIARESIKRLETLLAPAGFVRIERSLLLNVRAIAYAQPRGHGSFSFTLVSGARLRSGHGYRETILQALPLRRRAPAALPASR
jgi:two-component system, LytTR family, response regulator